MHRKRNSSESQRNDPSTYAPPAEAAKTTHETRGVVATATYLPRQRVTLGMTQVALLLNPLPPPPSPVAFSVREGQQVEWVRNFSSWRSEADAPSAGDVILCVHKLYGCKWVGWRKINRWWPKTPAIINHESRERSVWRQSATRYRDLSVLPRCAGEKVYLARQLLANPESRVTDWRGSG